VRNPGKFDVIVATNFYGDILSDLASELAGSIGLAGSYMASDTHCCAQAQHGSAPDIAGQDKANPASMILSTAMLLQWIGSHQGSPVIKEAGEKMEEAVDLVLQDPVKRTSDLDGPARCSEFGNYVAGVFLE
jgi:3-isopropylmalate dehydrogenase